MKTFSILFFGLAIVASGCKNNSVETGSDMTGRVIPLDINDTALDNLVGTTVWLQGTNYSATSDSTGHWMLTGIPAGIYTVLFARTGFDTTRYGDQRVSGAGTYFMSDANVDKLPTDSVVLDFAIDTAVQNGNDSGFIYLNYGGHISSSRYQGYLIHCSIDSLSNRAMDQFDTIVGGIFSGVITELQNPISGHKFRITKGQKIFLTIELQPIQTYQHAVGHKPDLSNIIAVTIP